MYSVVILKSGYSEWAGPSQQRAAGTITLVTGPNNLIIDTGLPTDRKLILNGLKTNNLHPHQIQYVICTCGQSDHIGNNNLFPDATFVVSYDISVHDRYTFFPFKTGQLYKIDDSIQIIPTPGHTDHSISVLVKTQHGTIAITGDLFEHQRDLTTPELWRAFSDNPETQQLSRHLVLELADFIVPGHGDQFPVPGKKPPSKWLAFNELSHRIARSHSPDFRSVRWHGEDFHFSSMQAICIEALWKAFENDTPDLSQAYLLECCESSSNRLFYLFKRNPAWGKLVVPGATKGTFRLTGS